MRDIIGEHSKTSQKYLFENLSLETIFVICQDRKYGCAVYSLPSILNKEKIIHMIIDISGGRSLDHLHLDEMGSGFIVHPFSSDNHDIKFINKDIHLIEKSESRKVDVLHSELSFDELNSLFGHHNRNSGSNAPSINHKEAFHLSTEAQKKEYISLISKTINEIKNGIFQKAVIARRKSLNLPTHFDPFSFFKSVANQYNNAFVYLTSSPKTGLWLGATPETLISIDKNRHFKTIALAATQAYREEVDLEDTTWSQKDIEEQAMVSRYIINCFKKIRLREFEEIGPRTHLSGNLVHLKTDYIVDMDQVAFPQLGTVMLELLHPTSAVCGMPKEPAQNFILNNEGFDREYFSGFLGPVNVLDETNVFVNLRCMKIMHQKAKLFAGAGIISNSIPEKEWNETEIKMETLLKVLKPYC